MENEIQWRSPDDEPADGTECVLLMRLSDTSAYTIFGRFEIIGGNGDWLAFLPDGRRVIVSPVAWLPLPPWPQSQDSGEGV